MADRIAISSFSFQYSQSTPSVISDVTLEIRSGSCCALIGPTGAGKSTLLHCISGTMRRHHPDSFASGNIQIGGSLHNGLPDHILFPAVGLVLQDPHVQISGVCDTVYDEILFTLQNMGQLPTDPERTVQELMRDLGIGQLAARKPTHLSGGETQRVALATILVARPSVLLLDEPTVSLDTNAQERLRGFLRTLKGKTTIVLTDTQLDFALGLCDQIIVLERGKILFDGEPAAFLRRIKEFSSSLPTELWIDLVPGLTKLLEEPSRMRSRIAEAMGLR